jgi:hypothetical protein
MYGFGWRVCDWNEGDVDVIGEDVRFEDVVRGKELVLGVEDVEAVVVVYEGEAGGLCIAMIVLWRSRVKCVLWNMMESSNE